jgi:hypothetical protein
MNSTSFLANADGSIPTETVKAVNPFKVGEILVGTWGYEACLATFVKVVGITGKSVKLVELDQHQTGTWVAGTAMPIVSKPIGQQVKTKKVNVSSYNNEPYIKWSSYQSLFRWNGEAINTYNHH